MATTQQTLYQYKGRNKQGVTVQGELRASTPAIVKAQLRKQGVITTTVKKKPKPLFSKKKSVKPSDIATFMRQMATMMKAGVPLVQSFEIVAEGSENESLTEMIGKLHTDVSAGIGFAQALRKFPRHFDDLTCSLVEAGETSGSLEEMLDRVATYKEKNERLKAKIKKALTYPAAVIVVGVVVTGILLVKVIPVFAEVYESFGAGLPAFTQFVLHLSEVAQQWWLIVIITAILLGVAFKEAKLRSAKFADTVDKLTLKVPIVGNIVYEAIIARFSNTLSTTFAAGVPLIDALNSVAGASGNAVFRDATLRVKNDVSTGIQLNQALRSTGLFPVLLLQLVAIGEESGALDEMMAKAASHYEESVDDKISNLTSLLEPMIMSVLGVLVGGLLIAMYLPIFYLGNVI